MVGMLLQPYALIADQQLHLLAYATWQGGKHLSCTACKPSTEAQLCGSATSATRNTEVVELISA